jgi:hypothetical protein
MQNIGTQKSPIAQKIQKIIDKQGCCDYTYDNTLVDRSVRTDLRNQKGSIELIYGNGAVSL